MPLAYTKHELKVNRAARLKTVAGSALFFVALNLLAWSTRAHVEALPADALPRPSAFRTACAFAAHLIMLSCWYLEVFCMPDPHDPSRKGTSAKDRIKWGIMQTPLAMLSFFTCQCLVITACLHFLWLAGEASLLLSVGSAAPELAAHLACCLYVAHRLAPFTASMGTILPLLFLKLCWFHEAWREDVLKPSLKFSPRFGAQQLYLHCASFPVGAAALLVAQDKRLLSLSALRMPDLLGGSIAYALCYVAYMFTTHARLGVAIYPFLHELDAVRPFPLGWLGFTAAMMVLLTGLVLGFLSLV